MLLTPYHRVSKRILRKRMMERAKIQNMKEESEKTIKNLCIECGIDIGDNNQRQLCGKTYCIYNEE